MMETLNHILAIAELAWMLIGIVLGIIGIFIAVCIGIAACASLYQSIRENW